MVPALEPVPMFFFGNPALGRWHTMDPADEFNSPYVYCRNNPTNYFDPDGMDDVYMNQDGSSQTIPTGFWSFDWLFGDSYYYEGNGQETDNLYGGKYYWEVESAVFIAFKEFGKLGKLYENGDQIINNYFEDLKGWRFPTFPWNIAEIIEKSPSGAAWDTKQYYSKNDVFIIDGKGYLPDYMGNVVWGKIMDYKGVPLIISQSAAGLYQLRTEIKDGFWSGLNIWLKNKGVMGDDKRDSKAINHGYNK